MLLLPFAIPSWQYVIPSVLKALGVDVQLLVVDTLIIPSVDAPVAGPVITMLVVPCPDAILQPNIVSAQV